MILAVDIGDSTQGALNEVLRFLPEFVMAIVILIAGYFIAKMVGGVVWRALQRAGLDRAMHGGQAGSFVQKITSSPSRLLGRVAYWAIFLGAASLAISVLGINALTNLMGEIFAYLPNVLAALLIFVVAGAISAGVATLVGKTMGDTPLGKIVATAAPILVMTIATFMILDQLMIAESIVTITYAGLIGAIALGSALAFGLGGRDVAKEMLQGAYQKGQENKEQFKEDLDQGMQRGREMASDAQDKMQEQDGSGQYASTTVTPPTA